MIMSNRNTIVSRFWSFVLPEKKRLVVLGVFYLLSKQIISTNIFLAFNVFVPVTMKICYLIHPKYFDVVVFNEVKMSGLLLCLS